MAVTPEEAAKYIVRIVHERSDPGTWGMLHWLTGPFNIDPYEPEDAQPGLAFALDSGWIEVEKDRIRVTAKGQSAA